MGLGIENPTWRTLYRTGGIAALLAAILFRRNIGAEVSLFTGVEAIPHSAADWYALLQSNPFVGLSFLAVFDLVDYALVGLIFLALAAALWSSHRSMAAIALASGMVGVAVSLASNISLTLFSLSQQYAAATSAAQQAALLAAGQAVLATMTRWPSTRPQARTSACCSSHWRGCCFRSSCCVPTAPPASWDYWPAAATWSTA